MRLSIRARRTALGLVLALTTLAASPVRADGVLGTWQGESGRSRVKFETCGDALCGSLVWLKPGVQTDAKLGQKIFYDMKPTGANAWSGSAFNPEDNKTYSGKMSLAGNTLVTSGCALAGLICKSVSWSRVP